MQGLVTLLEAYENCLQRDDEQERKTLAFAICQGFSPDPELFVNRLDLLGPYCMIETLFISIDSTGKAVHTATGQRHLMLLQQYGRLLARLAPALLQDCLQQQHDSPYSPYGALYGFASNLLELMAFKALQQVAAPPFSMEDVFTGGGPDKLTWVNGWRQLPHIKPEVLRQFDYPRQFVQDIGARVAQALQRRVATTEPARAGRLLVGTEQARGTAPLRCILSSDPQLVAAGKATAMDEGDLLHCRLEGEFLASWQAGGGWVAISKDLLTTTLGAGHDVTLAGLPALSAEVPGLMYPAPVDQTTRFGL